MAQIHNFAMFTVAKGNLESALEAIMEFTEMVNKSETGCLLYRSLQDQENSYKFTHYMIFEDEKANEIHRNTEYVKKFVDKLYPLLEENPVFRKQNVIAG